MAPVLLYPQRRALWRVDLVQVRAAFAEQGHVSTAVPMFFIAMSETSWRVELASQLQVLGSAHYPHRDFVMYRGGGYGGRGYGGGGYYNSPFRTFINISDLFFYWDPYYSRRQRMMRRESTGPNFFEAIFSFGEAPAGARTYIWHI